MKIIIMRHAKVLIEHPKIYANEMQDIVKEYDVAEIEQTLPNEEELLSLAKEVNFSVSSGLRRSVESLALLGKKADCTEKLFLEAELPRVKRKFLKLPLFTWGFWFRIAWVLGFSGGSKSYKESKAEAKDGAKLLMAFAEEHGTVLLMGHGLKNLLVTKALKKEGWSVSKKVSLENWGYGVFEMEKN